MYIKQECKFACEIRFHSWDDVIKFIDKNIDIILHISHNLTDSDDYLPDITPHEFKEILQFSSNVFISNVTIVLKEDLLTKKELVNFIASIQDMVHKVYNYGAIFPTIDEEDKERLKTIIK